MNTHLYASKPFSWNTAIRAAIFKTTKSLGIIAAGAIMMLTIVGTTVANPVGANMNDTSNPLPALSAEETRVIRNKGTEAPFSGKFWDHSVAGTYACRQCGAELYKSADKFDSGCGWPSFDDAVPGAVKRVTDADGRRTEILCAACGGHLGHVFEGEGLTAKNTRHCVNSVSMTFTPAELSSAAVPEATTGTTGATGTTGTTETTAEAVFAGGCFWGVEDAFSKVDGVLDVVSGYTGGNKPNPTYNDVCTGRTGHAEAVRVSYDPSKVTYETLARLFFEIHDPTQSNRQGPDVGTQYRSAVFYANAQQKAVAEALIERLRGNGYNVMTSLEPAAVFYEAEDSHQDFTARTGRGGCHVKVPRFDQPAR